MSTEIIQTSKTELTDLRRTLQSLEIELQSQLSMVRCKWNAEGVNWKKERRNSERRGVGGYTLSEHSAEKILHKQAKKRAWKGRKTKTRWC